MAFHSRSESTEAAERTHYGRSFYAAFSVLVLESPRSKQPPARPSVSVCVCSCVVSRNFEGRVHEPDGLILLIPSLVRVPARRKEPAMMRHKKWNIVAVTAILKLKYVLIGRR